jgi:signal peptidase II
MRWSASTKLETTDSSLAVAIPQNRHVVFWGIAVSGCALDLLTKHSVFQWRGMPGELPIWWIWNPYIGIETALNPGALFGMGAGFGTGFAVLSVLAAVGVVVWLFWFRAARDLLLTIALGCVMAGIGGNLYDRLGLWQVPGVPGAFRNEVRDWILFRYRDYTWPNFNIADSLLVCGACLLLWHGLRGENPQASAVQADPSETPTA